MQVESGAIMSPGCRIGRGENAKDDTLSFAQPYNGLDLSLHVPHAKELRFSFSCTGAKKKT